MGAKFQAIEFTQHCCGGEHAGGRVAEVRGHSEWLRIRVRRSNGEIHVTRYSGDGSTLVAGPEVMTEEQVEALL